MRSKLCGKILGQTRGPSGHFALCFDRDGGGALILPGLRMATMPVKNNTTCTSRLNLDGARSPRDHTTAAGRWRARKRHEEGQRGVLHCFTFVNPSLTRTAGVLAHCLLCAGPPDTRQG
eukprot:1015326-Pyramimonas_sp.AAC.1